MKELATVVQVTSISAKSREYTQQRGEGLLPPLREGKHGRIQCRTVEPNNKYGPVYPGLVHEKHVYCTILYLV